MAVDCSPERVLERDREILQARTILNQGTSNLTDRSRSVGYDLRVLAERLSLLEQEKAICEAGGRRPSRLSYNHLIKAL